MKYHAFANLFPLLGGEPYQALCEDIRQHGLRDPILVHEHAILDGRNRYRACQDAGVEPRYESYSGNDPLADVISANLHRRHLSESQRAMVAAQLANMTRGGDRSKLSIDSMVSRQSAADLTNVGVASVHRAARVLREASPEVIASIQQGDLSVSKAVKVLRGETNNIHVSDGSYEWYTPATIVEAARQVMGGIDLDPASCAAANRIVQAARYYSREEDGLTLPCSGRVFLNPPYCADLVQAFSQRLIDAYDAGSVTQGVLLVNNATETRWGAALLRRFPVCFPTGRLAFWSPERENLATRQGQMILGIGVNLDHFASVFSSIGIVLHAYSGAAHPQP